MPRPSRYCPAGMPVHLIQRGNNRQVCFVTPSDHGMYAHFLGVYAKKFDVAIHAWVFMTNHVHLLATPQDDSAITNLMHRVGGQYVRYFNYTYSRTGSLFEGRFRSSLVQQESYFLTCQRYIELNPVRAGMVGDPASYPWSSYRAHAEGKSPTMWTPHRIYDALGDSPKSRQKAYRDLVSAAFKPEVLTKIRHCANAGLVLGDKEFQSEISTRQARG